MGWNVSCAVAVVWVAGLCACGGDDGASGGTDAGLRADGGATEDGGGPGTDAGGALDAGGAGTDGGATTDGGTATADAGGSDAAVPEGWQVLSINLQNAYLNASTWPVRRDAIAAAITAWQPDAVCVQEAVTTDGPNGAEAIADATGYDHVLELTHDAFVFEEGIAALSRHTITASDTEHLPITDLGFANRAMLSVDLDTPDGAVRVFCSHMSISTDEGDKADEAAAAFRFMDERRTEAPSFFAGDLNAEPDTRAMRILRGEETHDGVTGDLLDAWTVARPGDPGFTIPSDAPDRRIDYVYVVPGTGAGEATVLDCERVFTEPVSGTTYASDHLGLLCRFDLPE